MRTYYTNVFAAFWLCKAAVQHMQAGSSIIVTTSILAYQPSPSLLDCASTKECALIGDHGHRPGAQHLGGPLLLGRSRVNGSDVIIALLREMMRNEAPQTKIVDVIEREGRR
jgi:hypothetical protein